MKLVETYTELQASWSHLTITAVIFSSPCLLILESSLFFMLSYISHLQLPRQEVKAWIYQAVLCRISSTW